MIKGAVSDMWYVVKKGEVISPFLKGGLRGILALLFSTIFFCFSSLHARQAILLSHKGVVEVQTGGQATWKKVTGGKLFLKDGDKLRTLSGSKATLLFEDGSKTEVYPETTLTMAKLTIPVNLGQDAGRTRNKVTHLGAGFSLRTPTAVCSVRGTDFVVGISQAGMTQLDVYKGVVNANQTATGQSVDVSAGHTLNIGANQPMGTPQPLQSNAPTPGLKALARKEVALDMTRDQIQAAAAEEMKLAEYQEGKSLIDVNGNRVRLEEYILRKPKELDPSIQDRAFKFVVLNERANRFDYFTYRGIFNKTLPDDLSQALSNASGRSLGATAPNYYLVSYEMTQSNLNDAIKDMADGGHLVEVRFNTDGSFTLIPHTVNSDGTPGPMAAGDAQKTIVPVNGVVNGKVYDPVADVYKQPGASLDGVYDATNDSFRQMNQGDTLWRTVFNRYAHLMGPGSALSSLTLDSPKGTTLAQPWFQYWSPKVGVTNIATMDQSGTPLTDGTFQARGKNLTLVKDQDIGDAHFMYLNGHYAFDAFFPDSANKDVPLMSDNLHQRLITYYPNPNNANDIPYEQYDTHIIDDNGVIAPISAFAGATSGAAFKQKLIQYNYEQITRSSAYGGSPTDPTSGRNIDIVVEPKIFIKSGLIK